MFKKNLFNFLLKKKYFHVRKQINFLNFGQTLLTEKEKEINKYCFIENSENNLNFL